MKDHVRDDVRDESLETPLYKGFLLKNVRDERFLRFIQPANLFILLFIKFTVYSLRFTDDLPASPSNL